MKKQTLNKLLFIFILVILVNIAPKVAKADTYQFGVGGYDSMIYLRNISGSLNHTGTTSSPFVPGEVLSFLSGLQCTNQSNGTPIFSYPSCINSATLNLSIKRGFDQFVLRDFGNLYNQTTYPSGSLYDNRSVSYTIPSNFTNKDTNPQAYTDVPIINVTLGDGASVSNVQPSFGNWLIAAPVTNAATTGTVTLRVYRNSDNSIFTQNANKVTTVGMAPGTPIHINLLAVGFNTNIVCYLPNGTKTSVGTTNYDYYPPNPFVTTTYSINCSDSGTTTSVTTDSVIPHGPYVVVCATVTSVEPLSVRGVAYGLNPNPTTADSTSTTGNGTGQICTGAGGNVGSSYYARGFATTSSGITIYGSNIAYGPLTATAY